MGDVYTIKKFGNALHIILPKSEFKEGQEVLVTDDLLLKDRLTDVQKKEVILIIQDELYKARNGY